MAAEAPLRVALLEPAGRGGIHQHARALAAALAAAGARVALFTARHHEFADADRAAPPAFAVEARFERRRTRPLELLAALRRFAPDVLHLQSGTHPLLHLALLHAARVATGARAVVTAHDLVPKNGGAAGAWLAARLHRAADGLVVLTESVRSELLAREPALAARVVVVPHGEANLLAGSEATARDDEPPAARARPPTLLFFGYLHPEKGLEDLIDALPAIVARVPDARLLVAGEPEQDVAALKQRAAAAGVAQRIEWRLGYVERSQVGALFARATAVVLPYRAASQSGVVHLAGACGKPLIATRVGALPESIEDGVGGVLVPPRDPAALAAAAASLLAAPGRAEEMGKAHARRCRSEGAWPRIAQRTLALYARVAGAPARHGGESGGDGGGGAVVDAARRAGAPA